MNEESINLGKKLNKDLSTGKINLSGLAQREKEAVFRYLQDECRKIVEADAVGFCRTQS